MYSSRAIIRSCLADISPAPFHLLYVCDLVVVSVKLLAALQSGGKYAPQNEEFVSVFRH